MLSTQLPCANCRKEIQGLSTRSSLVEHKPKQLQPWGHSARPLPAALLSCAKQGTKVAGAQGGRGDVAAAHPWTPRFYCLSPVIAKLRWFRCAAPCTWNHPTCWSTLKSRQDRFLPKFLGAYGEAAETNISFMGFPHVQIALEGQISLLSGRKSSVRFQSLA